MSTERVGKMGLDLERGREKNDQVCAWDVLWAACMLSFWNHCVWYLYVCESYLQSISQDAEAGKIS